MADNSANCDSPSTLVSTIDRLLFRLQTLRTLAACAVMMDRSATPGGQIFMANQAMRDAMLRIDDATNQVADRFRAIAEQVANGVSGDEAAQLAAQINADADRLNAIGANPDNPVPPATGDTGATGTGTTGTTGDTTGSAGSTGGTSSGETNPTGTSGGAGTTGSGETNPFGTSGTSGL